MTQEELEVAFHLDKYPVTLCEKCSGTGTLPGGTDEYPAGGCCPMGHAKGCACLLCIWRKAHYADQKRIAQLESAARTAEAQLAEERTAREKQSDALELVTRAFIEADSGRRDEALRFRDAVLWAYQLAGVAGCPVEALDNLSALSDGRTPPHAWPYPAGAELIARLESERATHPDAERLDRLEAIGPLSIVREPLNGVMGVAIDSDSMEPYVATWRPTLRAAIDALGPEAEM